MFLLKGVFREGVKPARFLCVLALFGISYGFYRGIQDNYLADVIRISAFQRGLVEFFRETPGLLVVLILAGMYRFTETRVFKIGIGFAVAGLVGLLATAMPAWDPPGRALFSVVIFMVVFSLGEHVIMPVRTTLSLNLAAEGKGGAVLGVTGALGHIGNIAGFVVVTAFFALITRLGFTRTDIIPFRIVFAVSLALMLAAFFTVLALGEEELKVKRRRFYFARKFTKYYYPGTIVRKGNREYAPGHRNQGGGVYVRKTVSGNADKGRGKTASRHHEPGETRRPQTQTGAGVTVRP
jgi:MFS family permease